MYVKDLASKREVTSMIRIYGYGVNSQIERESVAEIVRLFLS